MGRKKKGRNKPPKIVLKGDAELSAKKRMERETDPDTNYAAFWPIRGGEDEYDVPDRLHEERSATPHPMWCHCKDCSYRDRSGIREVN